VTLMHGRVGSLADCLDRRVLPFRPSIAITRVKASPTRHEWGTSITAGGPVVRPISSAFPG
jgi:hypothetical protein